MLVDLVKTTTSDGLRLDGVLIKPQPEVEKTVALDAVICLHGAGSNFYGSSMMETLAESLSGLGPAVLRVNTRGHDAISTASIQGRPLRQGAAFEMVDECRHDIAAWVELLQQRGFSRVGLLGHSLGALKALYSQAYQPHPSVVCLVAVSPPRLAYSYFRNSLEGATFFETLATAEQYVSRGKPQTLMEVRFPLPLIISAATYVDKYGREEKYNLLKFVEKIATPTLFIYGSVELKSGSIAFTGMDQTLNGLKEKIPGPVEICTIPGAGHFYSGVHPLLATEINNWLRQALPC